MILATLAVACGSKDDKKQEGAETLPPPPKDQLVIYEVFVRNFSPEGSFRGVIAGLDSLKSLGVNTLWLMPIHPVGVKNRKGEYGSPYSIRDFYDVNPEFGTKEDFKALVDAVHAKGMYIIIDLVANHSAFDNAWIEQHPDWYTRNDSGQIVPPVADWSDVADLNYDNPEVPEEMTKVMEYWVKEFDIDGYRCDVAEMVPTPFWAASIKRIQAIKPVIMLAEGAKPELYEAGFDFTYGWEVYHQLKKIFDGESATSFAMVAQSETAKVIAGGRLMRFITNHDETSWDDVPVNLFKSREGSLAAFAASIFLPSIPLIYNGQEVGHPEKMNLFEKNEISWTANAYMRDAYKQMLSVYHNEAVLRGNEITYLDSTSTDVIMYQRGTGDQSLFILVNVRGELSKVSLPASLQGKTMLNLLTGKTVMLQQELNIIDYGVYVLKPAALS